MKGIDLVLLTSHLESMATHSDERKRQLKAAFKTLVEVPAPSTVIFGGDLNLRDKEVREPKFRFLFVAHSHKRF